MLAARLSIMQNVHCRAICTQDPEIAMVYNVQNPHYLDCWHYCHINEPLLTNAVLGLDHKKQQCMPESQGFQGALISCDYHQGCPHRHCARHQAQKAHHLTASERVCECWAAVTTTLPGGFCATCAAAHCISKQAESAGVHVLGCFSNMAANVLRRFETEDTFAKIACIHSCSCIAGVSVQHVLQHTAVVRNNVLQQNWKFQVKQAAG